jgi:hypothetical protein
MNVLFHQSNVLTFWWILPNEIFWPSLFTKLLFRNISGVIPLYDQSVKSWEFRIREMRYCWEGNTMLLRGKCDVLINVTWDCFDQSNFYISRINIIEWNNMLNTMRAILELYHDKNKLLLMKWWWCLLCTRPTCFAGFL